MEPREKFASNCTVSPSCMRLELLLLPMFRALMRSKHKQRLLDQQYSLLYTNVWRRWSCCPSLHWHHARLLPDTIMTLGHALPSHALFALPAIARLEFLVDVLLKGLLHFHLLADSARSSHHKNGHLNSGTKGLSACAPRGDIH